MKVPPRIFVHDNDRRRHWEALLAPFSFRRADWSPAIDRYHEEPDVGDLLVCHARDLGPAQLEYVQGLASRGRFVLVVSGGGLDGEREGAIYRRRASTGKPTDAMFSLCFERFFNDFVSRREPDWSRIEPPAIFEQLLGAHLLAAAELPVDSALVGEAQRELGAMAAELEKGGRRVEFASARLTASPASLAEAVKALLVALDGNSGARLASVATDLRSRLFHAHLENVFDAATPSFLAEMIAEGRMLTELEATWSQLAENLEEGFSPAPLVDLLAPLRELPTGQREDLRARLHRLYMREFQPERHREEIGSLVAALRPAAEKFGRDVRDGGLAAATDSCHALHHAARELRAAVGRLPKRRWIP